MKKNPLTKLFSMVRGLDSYGHPINLTYNGGTTYKSTLGGFMTILARLAIFGYLISELLNVIDKKSNVQISEYIRNTALDTTQYNFTQKDFDMAVRLNYFTDSTGEYNKHLYRYAKVTIAQISFAFVVING